MNIQFKLRADQPDRNNQGVIELISYYHDPCLKISTKIKCSLEKTRRKVNQQDVEVYKYWDEKSQRFHRCQEGCFELNALLDQWEEKVKRYAREYAIMHQGIMPTPEQIKEATKEKKELNKRKTFWDLVDKWISFCRKDGETQNRIADKRYYFRKSKARAKAPNTIKNYQTAFNHLRNFERLRGKKLRVNEYTDAVHDEFMDYLFSTRDYHPNSIWSLNKSIRTFFEFCVSELDVVLHPKHAKMEWSYIETDKNHLTPEELNALAAVQLPPDAEKIRDAFLFACVTSPRDSDLRKLTKENLIYHADGAVSIRFFPQKVNSRYHQTVRAIDITLNNIALDILKKYDYGANTKTLLPMVANQTINEKIKEICQLAGITQLVEKINFVEGVAQVKFVPKYTTISTHTARHTFGVVSCMLGMNLTDIKNVMGHKKLSTTETYLKISKRYSGDRAVEVWNNANLKIKV